jgi:hypothetical protein
MRLAELATVVYPNNTVRAGPAKEAAVTNNGPLTYVPCGR